MASQYDPDSNIRSFAHSVVDRFGARSSDIAQRQAALAADRSHVAKVWLDITSAIQKQEQSARNRFCGAPQQRSNPRMMSSAEGMAAFLIRLLLRSELDVDAQRDILALKARVVRTPARQDLVVPGETVDHACLVLSGLLGRFDQGVDGNRQISAVHLPGDMCDLHSVVSPTTAYGLTALSATTTLQVPHNALKNLVAKHPQIAMAFWRDTTADASILAKWISNLGRKSALARLSHLLCEMGVRLELAGAGERTSYAFDVTQEQFAAMLGLTAVHVNRMFQMLRSASVMTMRGRRVEINDWPNLAGIGDFDPSFLLLPHERNAA